ncbi:hypothetical protein FQR65_LT05063 [Abscondita terminalis]|nr:hypothetical protein FQR65_LT05063 [Abscondita terminalis]
MAFLMTVCISKIIQANDWKLRNDDDKVKKVDKNTSFEEKETRYDECNLSRNDKQNCDLQCDNNNNHKISITIEDWTLVRFPVKNKQGNQNIKGISWDIKMISWDNKGSMGYHTISREYHEVIVEIMGYH